MSSRYVKSEANALKIHSVANEIVQALASDKLTSTYKHNVLIKVIELLTGYKGAGLIMALEIVREAVKQEIKTEETGAAV